MDPLTKEEQKEPCAVCTVLSCLWQETDDPGPRKAEKNAAFSYS